MINNDNGFILFQEDVCNTTKFLLMKPKPVEKARGMLMTQCSFQSCKFETRGTINITPLAISTHRSKLLRYVVPF